MRALALAAWVFLGFVVAQLAVAAVVNIVKGINPALLGGINQTVLFTVVAVFVYAIAIAIIIGLPWLIKKQKTTREDVGLHRMPSWMDILWAPAGLVAYLILTSIMMLVAATLLPFVDINQAQDTGIGPITSQYQYILAFISLVVLAPVAEEVLFRGYLFGKLRKFTPVWVAIVITSLLFGLVHFQWNVGIDTFALSVVMCLLRVVSGSLWPAILLHMIKNGTAFYFLFVNTGLLSTLGG